eukprot:IDg18477t1
MVLYRMYPIMTALPVELPAADAQAQAPHTCATPCFLHSSARAVRPGHRDGRRQCALHDRCGAAQRAARARPGDAWEQGGAGRSVDSASVSG